ncbi:MAG: histidine kinase [Thermobifida fusca]|nr:histidine kinase [Thermobifida fusca]
MTRRWGERVYAAWQWGKQHRFTLADVGYAIFFFPLIVGGMAISVVASERGEWGLGYLPSQLYEVSPVAAMLVGAQLILVIPCLVAAAILVRRRRPELLLASSLLLIVLFGNVWAAPVALYSYAAWFTNRWRPLALWAAAHSAALAFVYTMWEPFLIIPLGVTFILLPLFFGMWVGTRRQLVENLRERAERLEREQHLRAETAIAAERTRIAREMHDVVAHRVSLMVLHAGGLEVSAPDERTAEIAELIRTTGREALSELREILGVLRNGEAAPTAPQPVLDDVGSLIDAACAAGANVDLTTTGTPRPLNAQVERTAYRVVQEALTNAVKHAPGAEIDVRIDYGRTALTVTVVNGPATVKVANPVPDSGYGLIGLRERLALVGGTFVAGPLADGGWWVRAIIPAAPTETPRPAEEIL